MNISNKLLVSLDILLEMREHVRRGEPPGNTANAVILSSLNLPSAPSVTPGETRYLYVRSYMMATLHLKCSQREIGTQQFVGYVASVLSLKVVMGMLRTALLFLLTW